MEGKTLRILYNVDNTLEKLLIDILDEDFKSDSKEIGYVLTSIKTLTKAIQDKIKSEENINDK